MSDCQGECGDCPCNEPKFKAGDRVRITSDSIAGNHAGDEGVIVEAVDGPFDYAVKFEGEAFPYEYNESELELIALAGCEPEEVALEFVQDFESSEVFARLEDVKGRYFESGAYRDSDDGKYDYEGFFSPFVLERRAQYMHEHRRQSDGELRDSDNWQNGIPIDEYMKSHWRHFQHLWKLHRRMVRGEIIPDKELEDALCAIMFNAEGHLDELLKLRD